MEAEFDRKAFERSMGMVIHVGDPRKEKPHQNMSRVYAFHERYPNKKVALVALDKGEYDDLKGYKEDWLDVVEWTSDAAVMDYLMDRLPFLLGAMVVQPTWYECENGHITRSLPTGELVEACQQEGCAAKVKIQQPLNCHHQKFAELFLRVLDLIRFDTTSGEYLYRECSPVKNIMHNMPYALGLPPGSAPQMEDFKGLGKGRPALVIAAGPSLKYDLSAIQRLKDECLIVAAGRCLKLLHQYAIEPDYIVSVEMFDWDSVIFDDLTADDVGETTLLYSPTTAPKTVQKWPGSRLCIWDAATATMIGREKYLLGGNSVAHYEYNFAASILESNPIVLVGCDLAYTEPITHAEGTNHAWPEEVKQKDGNFHGERIWVPCTGAGDRFHPECHRVACPHGVPMPSGLMEVLSSKAYANFCTLFEILIAKQGRETLNACPNGQRIAGTEYVNLSNWRA